MSTDFLSTYLAPITLGTLMNGYARGYLAQLDNKVAKALVIKMSIQNSNNSSNKGDYNED